MRLRTFIMKDAYSFDVDWKDSIIRLRTSAKLTNAFSRAAEFSFRSSKRRQDRWADQSRTNSWRRRRRRRLDRKLHELRLRGER